MIRAFAVLTLAMVSLDFAAAAEPKPDDVRNFTGKVIPLRDALADKGIKADEDPKDAVALVTDDGTLYTFVKNDASRLLFLDTNLHKRPLKITARIVPGTQMLKVEKVQTVVKGVVHNIDYWCNNCQFPNTQPGPCMCCGGPTEFRELPAK